MTVSSGILDGSSSHGTGLSDSHFIPSCEHSLQAQNTDTRQSVGKRNFQLSKVLAEFSCEYGFSPDMVFFNYEIMDLIAGVL